MTLYIGHAQTLVPFSTKMMYGAKFEECMCFLELEVPYGFSQLPNIALKKPLLLGVSSPDEIKCVCCVIGAWTHNPVDGRKESRVRHISS